MTPYSLSFRDKIQETKPFFSSPIVRHSSTFFRKFFYHDHFRRSRSSFQAQKTRNRERVSDEDRLKRTLILSPSQNRVILEKKKEQKISKISQARNDVRQYKLAFSRILSKTNINEIKGRR